ncbi:PIN domain protein (modular protein) [Thiocapsa sp. KS1]|nr:PIN domain protein (modular protein) [Thiocapsa sp. KS1]
MARDLILNPRARVWISAASICEIAIKYRLGRSDMPISGTEAIGFFRTAGYQFLPVEPEPAAPSSGSLRPDLGGTGPSRADAPADARPVARSLWRLHRRRLIAHSPGSTCSTPIPNGASTPPVKTRIRAATGAGAAPRRDKHPRRPRR